MGNFPNKATQYLQYVNDEKPKWNKRPFMVAKGGL